MSQLTIGGFPLEFYRRLGEEIWELSDAVTYAQSATKQTRSARDRPHISWSIEDVSRQPTQR